VRDPAVLRGDAEVLTLLNDVLTDELTATNQYFAHYKLQEHWGYPRLAAVYRRESLEEMRHAEAVIDRILYLEGVPNLQRLGSVRIGESVPEQFRLDLALEVEALERYHAGIALTEARADHGSRELLTRLLADEEEHLDWLETQLAAIEAVGEANYLAQHLVGD
jgi:bacterioferritin